MDETPLHRSVSIDTTNRPSLEVADAAAEPRHSLRSTAHEMIETALFILLIFLLVRGIGQNFKIEGQSMEPTMHTGQYILVNKIVYFHFDLNAFAHLASSGQQQETKTVYPFTMPKRGDVLVFEYPNDPSKDYIKRVIGLPGDSVEVKEGGVFVNSMRLDEPYLQGASTTCRIGDPCASQPIVVRPGTIFVMGDNRNNSSDSREWGELPLDRVIGKAWVSYWPREFWGVVSDPVYPQ